MSRHNFKNLTIWQKGMDLVSDTYNLIRSFPDIEKYGLSSQMIRSATSIPSNIAEGSSKTSDKHFNNYLETSLGSAFEWETQLNVALMQGYLSNQKFKILENKIQQIEKMISGFKNSLKS